MQPKDKSFSVKTTLNIRGRLLDLGKPLIMGIVNVTPDSFFGESRVGDEKSVLQKVERMLLEGAGMIDVGGYSSRPQALDITEEEEKARILWAIKIIAKEFPQAVVSIDTFRAAVANAAVMEGAGIINDISGGDLDPEMFDTVAKAKVPYILMHMRGRPQTMNLMTDYEDLLGEIMNHFLEKINQLRLIGVHDIIIDPGFGFAKTVAQNYELLKNLKYFEQLKVPVLAGLSRKSMIWKVLGTTAEQALNGTTALHMVALMNGAKILRVHDVKEAHECIKLFNVLERDITF